MRVLFCGSGFRTIVRVLRAKLPASVELAERDFSQPLEPQLADAHVILPSNAIMGAAQIAAAKVVRLIQQPAVGTEDIDKAAAKSRGIPVCHAPGTNAQSVAEAAILLLLAVARRLRVADAAFQRSAVGEPVGMEICGKTLGLVGRGGQGTKVRALAEALGMTVSVVHSQSSEADFFAMLAAADFVSIHCPLTERTRGLFGDRAFAAMKPGAHLINVSRGPVIDRAALGRALDRLGGVGLDVVWEEPWDPKEPLFSDPKVVVLPHIGGSTAEGYGRIADIIVENIRRLDSGEPLLHRLA